MIEADERFVEANNAGLYLVGTIGICMGVFVAAILLDKIRIWIFKPLIVKVDNLRRKEYEEKR